MRTAFAVWNGRIAPVFDVARQIHVIETNDGEIVGESQQALANEEPAQRAARLAALRIDTLVCGAVSRTLDAAIASCGISVVSFVAGDSRQVIHAWLGGRLSNSLFAMPGCRPQRGRRRVRGGRGPCVQGRPTRGAGGKRGRVVCPRCGEWVPRGRAAHSEDRRCPHCGELIAGRPA